MMPLVSVIILNYNTPDLVYACLGSLSRHLRVPHEVIVVDNGSEKRIDPGRIGTARLISLEKNLGFGGGNNAGALEASGTCLWFLNSDTELPDGSVNEAFAYLEEHVEIGALSPLLYNDRELTAFQADSYASFQSLASVLLRRPRPALDLNGEFFATDMVVAAAVIVPRALFATLGGFDGKIFMFFEDDDLCYRIRQAGYAVGIHTKSRIVHLQGKSISNAGKRKALYYRSQDYFWRKHYGAARTATMRALRAAYRALGG